MAAGTPRFYPFFDPYRDGGALGYPAKIGISLGLGAVYILALYLVMPDKMAFFEYNQWAMGAILSTSTLALYIAIDVFRRNLELFRKLEGDGQISDHIVSGLLSNRLYTISGICFGLFVVGLGFLFGVPEQVAPDMQTLVMVHVGYLVAGFSSGMGLLGVLAVITLYLRIAPYLQFTLKLEDSASIDGIKRLGDTLWFFGGQLACVGILVSIYNFSIPWAHMGNPIVRTVFLVWAAFPYIMAISVVLLPGLAVRRQIERYKRYMRKRLKDENARLFSDYKRFRHTSDDDIIAEKRALTERLENIEVQMQLLRKLRNSHIDDE